MEQNTNDNKILTEKELEQVGGGESVREVDWFTCGYCGSHTICDKNYATYCADCGRRLEYGMLNPKPLDLLDF